MEPFCGAFLRDAFPNARKEQEWHGAGLSEQGASVIRFGQREGQLSRYRPQCRTRTASRLGMSSHQCDALRLPSGESQEPILQRRVRRHRDRRTEYPDGTPFLGMGTYLIP